MDRFSADSAFLMFWLLHFITYDDEHCKQDIETVENSIDEALESDTYTGEMYRSMTPGLYSNFFNGYHKAIDKYGLHEGNHRIKEHIISVLLKNIPYLNRDSLIAVTVMVGKKTREEALKALMATGIHLQKDENGNYTMEE